MSVRKTIRDRIAWLTKEGVKYSTTDQPKAMELLIRLQEAKFILELINKVR